MDRILGCGVEGQSAVAYRIRQERTSSDTVTLGRLNQFLTTAPRDEFLEAVLDVARDTSASTPARVSALIALVRLAHPAMVVDYRAVTGGLDRAGSALNGCFAGRYAGDYGPSGLSASDAVRIRDLARAIPARYDAAHGCAIGRVLHSVIAALDFRAG